MTTPSDEDYFETGAPRALSESSKRRIIVIIIGIIVILTALAVSGQAIWFWLNIVEFGELFIRPFTFEVISGLILAVIALVRVDFKNRRSLVWWLIRLLIRLPRAKTFAEIPANYVDFKAFRMRPIAFAAWQVTKVLLLFWFFRNALFGLAVFATAQGWDPNLGAIWGIFQLPFVTPPFNPEYAGERVVPMIPGLTLIIGPVLGAVGLRLLILVGITQFARVVTPSVAEIGGDPRRFHWRIGIIEGLVALALFWTMFNAFFPAFIDFNSKVAILGFAAAGVFFAVSAYLDVYRSAGLSVLLRRKVLLRIGALIIMIIVASSVMAVQNNIADARKVEWRGPYTVQQIAVNRYLAELDQVRELNYNFSLSPVSPTNIDSYIQSNSELLEKIRLWDSQAAFAKLKPEIGLIPFVDFQDSDILRFNERLYWSASLKPVLPETVRSEDVWYAQHLVYTNAPNGFLMLDGHEGRIVDTGQFFNQRRVYYGEGGLLSEIWAAMPEGLEKSDEIGAPYDGTGGIKIGPPLSWLFEFNFFLAFRDQEINVVRYRDVYDRVSLLFPFFQYEFSGKRVDMWPVTDGERSYHLLPLIVTLDTSEVPWSGGNPYRRLVGFALIDIFSGEIQIFIIGNDFFSELMKFAYPDYVKTELPAWLHNQTRYPEELFEWRQSMYNFFHVDDPATFIVGNEFFEIPAGLDTYYIEAKPPGFEKPEFLGLLSAELRGAQGRNLAGYMIVRNDYPHLGDMIFYKVRLDSATKLLGPSAVVEALERNPDFATLRTLLRQPRLGDNILYRVGDHDVYFIPVYTAGAGGVVSELGAIAAVGATFTGEYYVGLGLVRGEDKSSKGAFTSFLQKLSGLLPREEARPAPEQPKPPEQPSVQPEPSPIREAEISLDERRTKLLDFIRLKGFTIAQPAALSPDVSFTEGEGTYVFEEQWNDTVILVDSFLSRWGQASEKILIWTDDESVLNIGVLVNADGIVELHAIKVRLR